MCVGSSRYAPACAGPHTGFLIGIMHNTNSQADKGWNFKAIGTPAQGRNFEQSMPDVQSALQVRVSVRVRAAARAVCLAGGELNQHLMQQRVHSHVLRCLTGHPPGWDP